MALAQASDAIAVNSDQICDQSEAIPSTATVVSTAIATGAVADTDSIVRDSDPVTNNDVETQSETVIISDENCATDVNSPSNIDALDEALVKLNNEVASLFKQSSDVLLNSKRLESQQSARPFEAVASSSNSTGATRESSSPQPQSEDANKYFDYSLYREASSSPPPHPLITYRWEDVRRDKEKVNLIQKLSFPLIRLSIYVFISGWLPLDLFKSARSIVYTKKERRK